MVVGVSRDEADVDADDTIQGPALTPQEAAAAMRSVMALEESIVSDAGSSIDVQCGLTGLVVILSYMNNPPMLVSSQRQTWGIRIWR